MKERFEIVVAGSGFAGSLMAMIAKRLGYSVALIERGKHPRFAIGESSTPLANLLLEELATKYDLPGVRPLCKWGTWQAELPQIGCGLKRGFTFYHHESGRAFSPDAELKRQLLVGASANESVADTHWYRADFDQYLVEQARKMGVAYFDEFAVAELSEGMNEVLLKGNGCEIEAGFLIDATGPRGMLHRALKLGEKQLPLLPPTQGLFSHFTDVGALPNAFLDSKQKPPYPPEQAAVHHIFPGGWIWVLKFNNGITSAGVAATDAVANGVGFRGGEKGWQKLLDRLPSLSEFFGDAKPIIPFVHQPRIGFQSAHVVGKRWAMLPSAAGVVDPLLSTGFPLTLFGVMRLGRLFEKGWEENGWADYERRTRTELEATGRLVGALYAAMDRFELFKQLSLLYFAAAHFSETGRRAGRPVDSFLLCGDEKFARELRGICEAVKERAANENELIGRVRSAIRPFDLIGLSDPANGPWYSAV